MTDTASDSTQIEAAESLRRAYREGPLAPISGRLIANDAASGYAVQDINTRHWIAQGRRPIGAKIGLTSPAVQTQIGVDQPDFGVLFEDMLVASGGETPIDRLLQPRAEGEIAFCLSADLTGADLQAGDIIAATAWIAPAIEIVDSRIQDWRCGIADTVADNASAGLLVLGEARSSLKDFDVAAATMTLTADGVAVSTGTGEACLGSPVLAMTWLARMMASLGRPLKAGDIVLSGALGPLVWLEPGVDYRLDIPGLGDAAIRFSSAGKTQ